MKKKLVALGMAFLMAMSTCMTAFAGYWYIEDGRWEYRDDSGARVRNTLKKSGSHYWWLGPDGYLRTGHAGEKVLIGNAAFMLHDDGRIDRIGEDASGGKVDLFDLIGDKETPRRFDTWDFYETAKDGSAYETWCYWDEEGNKLGGLQEIQGFKYYFDKETGVMATGDVTIDGQKYHFNSNGILSNTTSPTGSRTIKNYLAGALQPVGQALYVWGGGWNDSTRKGTSQTMTDFYNSQSSSYDYNNYRDLSTANRAKGFDCSGFVGWSAYQVMQSKSGVGSGYTVVSGEIGSYYKSMGWGSILTQANLASDDWTVYPGDVGYDSGHTWIILGQCADKSAVIVHSTPNAGVQIAGTPTPSGGYSSQAIALAQKYMSRYPGYTKYDYHTSSGNYIIRGNYLRWNRSTLSDPDGYMNMTADQILADLFS